MVVGYGTDLYRHIVPNGCSSAVTQRSISSNDVFPVRSKRPGSIQTNRTEQEIRYNNYISYMLLCAPSEEVHVGRA